MKELPTYITEILNDKEALENHYKVTKALYEHEIDFRQMNSLKLGFLRADKEHHHALPVDEFRKIFRATMKEHCDSQIEYKVLHLITVSGFLANILQDADGKRVELVPLNRLVDFYHYFPYFVKKDRNLSQELYYILSSNTSGDALVTLI